MEYFSVEEDEEGNRKDDGENEPAPVLIVSEI